MDPNEYINVKDIAEYIRTHKYKGFKPVPHYNRDGKNIELYWEDKDCYADPLNSQVTLMKAMDDHRVVGVKIYSIPSLVK